MYNEVDDIYVDIDLSEPFREAFIEGYKAAMLQNKGEWISVKDMLLESDEFIEGVKLLIEEKPRDKSLLKAAGGKVEPIPTVDGSIILNIAASLVRNKLSEFVEDWKFSKSTPVKDKRGIINAIIKQNEFQNRLALELKKLL